MVNQTFTVKIIIGCEQEVPTEGTEPRKIVGLVNNVTNGDDFMETFYLQQHNLKYIH